MKIIGIYIHLYNNKQIKKTKEKLKNNIGINNKTQEP